MWLPVEIVRRLADEQIAQRQEQAQLDGKAEHSVDLQLTEESGEVVAESQGLYQLRAH